MRLINSDGQIVDARVKAAAKDSASSNANRNSITLVDGRLSVIAICAVICGVSAAIAIWAGYQAQVMTTEYRVQLNHTMHLEAEQSALKTRVELLERNNAIKR